jgi:hypothetical protein
MRHSGDGSPALLLFGDVERQQAENRGNLIAKHDVKLTIASDQFLAELMDSVSN